MQTMYMICSWTYHTGKDNIKLNTNKLHATGYHQKKNFYIGQKNKHFLVCNLGSISSTCLHAAFTLADPKSAKRQSSHQQEKS